MNNRCNGQRRSTVVAVLGMIGAVALSVAAGDQSRTSRLPTVHSLLQGTEANWLRMGAKNNSKKSPTTKLDVGGAAFSTTKRISDTKTDTLLVAKGQSYLSYFYLGVCSSVLYLAPGAAINGVRFQKQITTTTTPIALEIYYHKPARAVDLQWATKKFIEANLPNNSAITDLPQNMQRQLSKFNALYRNIKVGDRYSLEYIPQIGMRLLLNDQVLGTVGMNMPVKQQQELARLIYSVWFGEEAPFSELMKKELLTPI